jgi:hypothetical protein
MAIPATGQIAMSAINVELGRSSTAFISLDAAENGTYATINVNSAFRPNGANPAAMSEWRRYNHSALPLVTSQTIYWEHFRGGPTGGTMQIYKNGSLVASVTAAGPTVQIGNFTANPNDNIQVMVFESIKTNDYCEIYITSNTFEYVDFQYDSDIQTTFVVQAPDGDYNINTRQDPFI